MLNLSETMLYSALIRPCFFLGDPEITHEQTLKRICGLEDHRRIEDPPVIVKILSHLGLPTRALPRAPARRDLFQPI